MRLPPLAALPLIAVLALAACRATKGSPELPAGLGLVSVDRAAPAGASLVERPVWNEGDRLVYRKGSAWRLPFRVAGDGSGWKLVQEDNGMVQRLDADFGDLGLSDGKQQVLLDPVDARYAWPLWVGKRWTCQFVRRTTGQPDLPLQAAYEVQGEETVRVPAGTYRCLRIWRTLRLNVEGNSFDRVAVVWYAPEVGAFVRQLDDGIVTELEEVHRQ